MTASVDKIARLEAELREAKAEFGADHDQELVAGFARCVNPACVSFEDDGHGNRFEVRTPDREIVLRRETVETRAPDLPSLVLGTTSHLVPINDADVSCPECGHPCAVLDGRERVYPKMVA